MIDVLTTIPFMFAGLVLPIMTVAWLDHKPDYFKNVLQKSFDFMVILAIPLVVGAQFLGRPIMIFAAGEDFAQSGQILQTLIFAVAAIFLGTMFSHAVIALDKQKKMISFYAFASFSSLVAYLFLIPRFSYFGAAAVTIYSETIIAIFSAYCVYKYSRFLPDLKIILKAGLSALIMGTFLYFFSGEYQDTLVQLLSVMTVASLIYFFCLFLCGGISKIDLINIIKRPADGGETVYSEPKL